jgi:hypothetical protein
MDDKATVKSKLATRTIIFYPPCFSFRIIKRHPFQKMALNEDSKCPD